MTALLNKLCCLSVLLIWLGPLLILGFCLAYGGCARLVRGTRSRAQPPRP